MDVFSKVVLNSKSSVYSNDEIIVNFRRGKITIFYKSKKCKVILIDHMYSIMCNKLILGPY